MSWKKVLKEVSECPNCGGKIRRYLDDPMDDSVARCEEAVKNNWEGKYADCYAQE